MTVAELREKLKDVSDDAVVFYSDNVYGLIVVDRMEEVPELFQYDFGENSSPHACILDPRGGGASYVNGLRNFCKSKGVMLS